MAATEQIFNKLIKQLCAADFGDPGFYPRTGAAGGLVDLCFPNYGDLLENGGEEYNDDPTAWIPRVQVIDEPTPPPMKGKRSSQEPTTKFVLDAAQMHQIACYVLPRELAFRAWKRLFSLGRDGNSFHGFMERIHRIQETLFIIKTTRGEIFGGYSDVAWEFGNNQTFHGGDRTKLFTFVDPNKRRQNNTSSGGGGSPGDAATDQPASSTSLASQPGESRDDREEQTEKKTPLEVYGWSGINRDYQYCDALRSLIAFGGGGGRFGLTIENNFSQGSTSPCETFGSDRLGSEEYFEILEVEVWGFVPSMEDSCCSSLLCLHPDPKPEEDMNWIPSVRVIRESPPENFILDQARMNQIACFVLPQTINSCRWKRVYSLSRDGDSFENCLHLIRKEPKSLMVIKTDDNQVFGGYADSPWRATNCNYYGSAQANLWTFAKERETTGILDLSGSLSTIEQADPNQVKVFKWTGINRYIQYCDMTHRILAFGGGGDGGSFGLCIEKEFQAGTTGRCATFGNKPLCNQEQFKILDLEIWGFATGKF